jgi:hypothetical protein
MFVTGRESEYNIARGPLGYFKINDLPFVKLDENAVSIRKAPFPPCQEDNKYSKIQSTRDLMHVPFIQVQMFYEPGCRCLTSCLTLATGPGTVM